MNPEEKAHYENVIKEEIEKKLGAEKEPNPLRSELYSAGGGLAGAGLGLASINAIDTVKEQSALRNADRENIQRAALQKLKDIHDGRTDWSSVNPKALPAMQEMYQENIDLLSDEGSFKSMMNQFGPRQIHRIAPEPKGQILKRMMPNVSLLDNLGENIKHPAVAAGALAGISGGYYLSKLTEK